MATFTLRKLDDKVAEQFKEMARDHGRSAEAELRSVVEEVIANYVEEKARSQQTGAEILARMQRIWNDSDLTEEEKIVPLDLQGQRTSQARDPFLPIDEPTSEPTSQGDGLTCHAESS